MPLFEWISCSAQLPDADQTVMTFAPESDEPVWPASSPGHPGGHPMALIEILITLAAYAATARFISWLSRR